MRIFRIAIIFLAIIGATTLLFNYTDIEFGKTDFWNIHSVLFLIFITLFPRLTLLFSGVAFGGFFWWIGWLFAPRFLVAVLATVAYWNTNTLLVLIAWIVALGGESSEKYYVHRSTFKRARKTAHIDGHEKIIEADYYEKKQD
jgi:hypothetical protein